MIKRHPGLFIFAVVFTLGLGISAAFAAAAAALQKKGDYFYSGWPVIAGTDKGLYGINRFGIARPLWTGGQVRKVLKSETYWAIISDRGILVSADLHRWEGRNRGLPVKTIKVYDTAAASPFNTGVSFIRLVHEIKDLEIDSSDPAVMVCASKNRVFLSRNTGRSWEDLGAPAYRIDGIKAVSTAFMPAGSGELVVFMSHGTYGVHYLIPGRPGARWTPLNEGIEQLETTDYPDEVSDIAAVRTGAGEIAVFAAQSFRRRIYRLDWERKRFTLLWRDAADFGAVDALDAGKETLRFVREGAVAELPFRPGAAPPIPAAGRVMADNPFNRDLIDSIPAASVPAEMPPLRFRPDLLRFIRSIGSNSGLKPTSMVIRERSFLYNQEAIRLSELWLLDETGASRSGVPAGGITAGTGSAAAPAADKAGLYLPVDHALNPSGLKPYLDLIRARNLNMVVIDMKDDYGRLRFSPRDPAITAKCRVFRPLDIDAFLRDMHSRNIYAAARVVVFKDPELARKEGGKYAVWDPAANRPWTGYRIDGGKAVNYDEQWVDPYSEEVWEYAAAVAQELHERGFDEIQFDYIRFPTDGVNLAGAQYRWRSPGMDMESAIHSFLRHVRSRIGAPLSIDIYGANGWYRTGARTGQEVELLAPYVDVICPMYYPSHFGQDFLAQHPAELRPYRIYYQGTLRTRRIARGQVVVRPYAQAFHLNVSFDNAYYGPRYVLREAEGVRRAGSGGLIYWNNAGRYGDIPVRR
ncbi:MAG: putative glycoside hydrolase [Treponema sp.]|jgi:hypothetical protein|nr:putative glycoside hydrolase [Treponema sp.]